ncbi:GNAT family N-acetyltransferase [Yoonia sp. 2307UL14-13]|uniref:GNAT family N-acetyltransferase n=1 Tax=Yoonia sp. 2307UL14-13 TaxID=3126506 RepID=UPI0030974E70
MILATKRLILREPRPDDLEPMFEVFSDPKAMRYWSTAPHETREVTKEVLDRRIARWQEAPLTFQITINDTYIGNCGNFQDNEVGFMLSPEYWRQGILTEAMTVVIPHLWNVTDHDHLMADADPNNAASCALLRKLGFHETHRAEKTFFINGIWSDSVYFALNRPTDLR